MWIWTDFRGEIVRASDDAAQFLHLSPYNLKGRPITHFFDGDRQTLALARDRTALGQTRTLAAVVRPREQRPCAVLVVVEPDQLHSDLVRWTLRPAPFKHRVEPSVATPTAA